MIFGLGFRLVIVALAVVVERLGAFARALGVLPGGAGRGAALDSDRDTGTS